MANGRSARKEEFWRLAIGQQEISGLNIKEFCKLKGVSEPSFYWWRREIRKRDNQAATQDCQLVPVKITDTAIRTSDAAGGATNAATQAAAVSATQRSGRADVEIELPTGVVVRVYSGAAS